MFRFKHLMNDNVNNLEYSLGDYTGSFLIPPPIHTNHSLLSLEPRHQLIIKLNPFHE